MTLTQLANFVRIAELQSLSKAAAVIRIAQPALSRQVRILESELGSPLLIRHAWGVTLTPAGDVLLARARRLLLEADEARDAIQALAAEPKGRVALGMPTSLATSLIPPLASALRDKYPGLRPYFVDGFSALLHTRTLAGDLDLAILYEDRAIGPLLTTPLLAENLMLVGSRGAAVAATTSAAMLADKALVLPARPNRLRLIIDEVLAQQPAAGSEIIEVDSLPAIIGIVQNGGGFTVLPYSSVSAEVASGSLKVWDLQFPQLSRTLLLVRPLARQPTAAVTMVEREVRRLVGDLAERLRWTPLTKDMSAV